jgi:hypothetical protein
MGYKARFIAGSVATGYGYGQIWGEQVLPGSSEEIETFSHNLRALGQGDIGGPFWLKRDRWWHTLPKISGGWANGTELIIASGLSTNPDFTEPSNSEMITAGATGIARTIPTAPSFNSLTSMSELMRDGVPSAIGVSQWREKTNVARGAGSEYLNYKFGWVPLISDMRNFARTVKNHHKILADLKAGSGKVTRTGFHFPSSTSSDILTGGCFTYFPGNSGISTATTCTYSAIRSTEQWFNGAFTYHLPVDAGQLGKAQRYAEYADTLLGLKPTPAAVWNAAPWSWAMDWFTNAGDIMTNISELGQNGMVLRYGYIMSSVHVEERILVPAQPGAWSGTVGPGEVRHVREYKKRLPSTPYGFGVVSSDLTRAQQAVIVALGLTGGRGGKG